MTNKGDSFAINMRGGNNLQSDPLRNFRFLVKFWPYWAGSGDASNSKPTIGGSIFGFTSVSGLTVATEAIPYREGGMNTTLHQVPGQTTFSPVTLSRGVHLGNQKAWKWMRRMFSVTASNKTSSNVNTEPTQHFRASVDVMVLNHPPNRRNDFAGNGSPDNSGNAIAGSTNDTVAVAFRMYNAWISSLAYSDLNAGDNALLVEQMVLAHEGFDMFWAKPKASVSYDTNAATPTQMFSH